ncbi:hypothetical protein SCG7109_AB_00300 [Chlamydiales bacterium SCGC AG-110-M15]|nr:hypothetical protein SCG7109_AB_00300 [Chlamydiales bacterium SCGC AG-110-M15]
MCKNEQVTHKIDICQYISKFYVIFIYFLALMHLLQSLLREKNNKLKYLSLIVFCELLWSVVIYKKLYIEK